MGTIIIISMIPAAIIMLAIPLLDHIPNDKMKKIKENFKNFFNLKKSWFKIVFSLSSAILGFIIMNNEIGGKIGGAILLFVIGLFASIGLNKLFDKIPNSIISNILKLILCILLLIFAFTRTYGTYKDPYGDVWDKDPNNWTDQEEDYVNDFFEWQHDYYDD